MRTGIIFSIVAAMLSAPAWAQTKLTVSFGPGSAWMQAFVAKDQGIFARHGLDVTMSFIPVGSNQPAALLANSIQIAGFNPTILVFAAEGGAELQAIAGANGQGKDPKAVTSGVLARSGSNIKGPADFVGKRVANPGINSVLHVAFMKWLKDRGTDPMKVNHVEVAINQMNDVMKAGHVDAAVTTEPIMGLIAQSGTGYMVSPFVADLADPFTIYSFWGATRRYVEQNPKVIAAFRAAITEATGWIEKNEVEARKTQMTYLKMPEKIAMTVRLPTFTPTVTRAQMQFWIDACRELGLVKGSVTADQLIAR
jgi:NitT/TauT family transport system substrate-binding protein